MQVWNIVHLAPVKFSKFNRFIQYINLFIGTLANNADPDEMLHYAAFHLRLQCLLKCSFTVPRMIKPQHVTQFMIMQILYVKLA